MEKNIQQQMFLTKDNELVYKENAEHILIFVEGAMNSPEASRVCVEGFLDSLGLDHLDCRICYVNNDYGYKHAVKTVKYWKKDCLITGETLVLVTNMTEFLYPGTFNTWDDQQKKFLTYVVDNNGVFHWIHDLTEKELRAGHNLESIYRNGGFDLDECD
jgi:hypothetical protein